MKSLIKEVKKEGRDPIQIDLTSQDVAQKLQKRRSNLHGGGGGDGGMMAPEGLLSAMNQLAWERDLDLEGPKIAAVPEEVEADVKAPKAGFLSKKSSSSDIVKENGNNNGNKIDLSFRTSSNDSMKPLNPQLLEMQMVDKHKESYSPGLFRSSRVSPEGLADKPPSRDKKKKNLLTGNSSRPPSARSSSGGSKDSKDSAFCEGRRRTNIAITGSRSSLNSASSLTSLLHNSVGKDAKDDTDF